MSERFKVRCERVRANNGIVEVLFIRRATMSDQDSHEEVFSMNIAVSLNRYEEGREYWHQHPEPAFPTDTE